MEGMMSKRKTTPIEVRAKLTAFANTHDIKEYTAHSIAKKLGLDRQTIVKYCEEMDLCYKQTSWHKKQVKQRPVLFKGEWYPSIAEAARITKIHRNTIEYHASEQIKQKYHEDYKKKKEKTQVQNYLRKTESWAKYMYDNIQERIRRGAYSEFDHSISLPDMEELFDQAEGKCFVCGLIFATETVGIDAHERPSPDRIDNSQGYSKRNIRIVCHLCNVNHRAELYTKRCLSCQTWLLHDSAFCRLCGEQQTLPTFEQNMQAFNDLLPVLLRTQTMSDSRRTVLLERLAKAKIPLKGTVIPISNVGLELVNSFMPNMLKAYKSNLCSWHSYLSDPEKMSKIIRKMTEEKARITVSNVKKYIRKEKTIADVYNFRPTAARLIYERYAPKDGLVYDYSCGYGGRLFGAALATNNVSYVGVEPNTETFQNLLKIKSFLQNTSAEVKIFNECAEDFRPQELRESVDVAFSSPPYYDVERYCDEPTQSWIRYRTYQEWKSQFLKRTIANCIYLLKPGGKFIVNIKNIGSANIADEVQELAEDQGLIFVEKLDLEFPHYRSVKYNKDDLGAGLSARTEPIFVFQKP